MNKTTPCPTRHAVILAAGESKRTRPLTLHRPKPLIPLLGKPLLGHILDELADLVERVTLVVGYRAEAIERSFGSHYGAIELRYVHQGEVNGTASALAAVAEHVAEPFFLLYGDNLVGGDDVRALCAQRYALAALRVEDARSFGVLDLCGDKVRRIIEKPADPPPDALANPGIYHFDQAVFAALTAIRPSPRGEYELTDLIELLAAEHAVAYHICAEHWVPVGTPWEALNASQFLLRRQVRATRRDPQAVIAPSATITGPATIGRARIEAGAQVVGPCWLDDGCVVEAGATIERCVLEAGAFVGAGATVRESALGAGTQLGAGCYVAHSLLDEGAVVGAGARLEASLFDELPTVAVTQGLLGRDELRTRGAVLARGATIAAGAIVAPGSVVG